MTLIQLYRGLFSGLYNITKQQIVSEPLVTKTTFWIGKGYRI